MIPKGASHFARHIFAGTGNWLPNKYTPSEIMQVLKRLRKFFYE